MKPRGLTVVAILLALGTVLYAFMPNIAGVTPDMVYVVTTLALLLVRPKIGFALAIGIVAGVLSMVFSKSSVPVVNVVTHPIGVVLATLVITYTPDRRGYEIWKPITASLVYGIASGGLAITFFWQLANLPTSVYLLGMWPTVLITSAIAAFINVILYVVARRISFAPA
jgi:hypothetical protein